MRSATTDGPSTAALVTPRFNRGFQRTEPSHDCELSRAAAQRFRRWSRISLDLIQPRIQWTSILPADRIGVNPAGKTVRVCSEYRGETRALLWINLAKDGSFYTGWCAKDKEPPSILVPERLPDGGERFGWNRSEPIDCSHRRPKTSFHASGVILSSGGRHIGVNLRLLNHRSLLCVYFPKHPENWPVVAAPRRRDLLVHNLIQDECPLFVDLYYQPAGDLPILSSQLDRGVFVAPVGFTGVLGHDRVLLSLVISRRPSAVRWAPNWIIGYPVLSAATAPVEREQWVEPGQA